MPFSQPFHRSLLSRDWPIVGDPMYSAATPYVERSRIDMGERDGSSILGRVSERGKESGVYFASPTGHAVVLVRQ